MVKCAYSVVIRVAKDKRIRVGSLGDIRFEGGLYIYTGSGYYRVKRHLKKWKRPFWHIDYLLNDEDASILWAIWCKEARRMECVVNQEIFKALGSKGVKFSRFGSSDCKAGCGSHLIKANLSFYELKSMLSSIYSSLFKEVRHL